MGCPLQSVFLLSLLVSSAIAGSSSSSSQGSKSKSSSDEKSGEAKMNGGARIGENDAAIFSNLSNIPESLNTKTQKPSPKKQRFGTIAGQFANGLPPRGQTNMGAAQKLTPPRFASQQNGQQNEGLKQLLDGNNPLPSFKMTQQMAYNGPNNVPTTTKQQNSSVSKNISVADSGILGGNAAFNNVQPVQLNPAQSTPFQFAAKNEFPQPPQQSSVFVGNSARHPSTVPTNPEKEYTEQKLRKELEYAKQRPEVWLADWHWRCPKGDVECEGWAKVYSAIRRFISLEEQLIAGLKELPLDITAVRPRFWPTAPNKSGRAQTHAIGQSLDPYRQRATTEPLYVEHEGMEMVQVMRMVEYALNTSKNGADNGNNPVYILNRELVEKVRKWAAFFADAVNVGQTGQIKKIYKIEEVGQPPRLVKTFEDFAQETGKARGILQKVMAEKRILDGFELVDWKVPSPPSPLELTDQVVDVGPTKGGALNSSLAMRQSFAQQWQPIVDALQGEKARETAERYAQRQQREQPRITRELVFQNRVLLIPRPDEIVSIVYLYPAGKALGHDLEGALAKAEYCLREILGNERKKMVELEAECPVPPITEVGREVKFQDWAEVAQNLNSDLPPTYLAQNGTQMSRDEILNELAEAFDAFVSGRKLEVFAPSVQEKRRIRGMIEEYQKPKEKVVEIVRNEKYRNSVRAKIEQAVRAKPLPLERQRIAAEFGPDGLTNAQRRFQIQFLESKMPKPKLAQPKPEMSERGRRMHEIFNGNRMPAEQKPSKVLRKKPSVWPASHHEAGYGVSG